MIHNMARSGSTLMCKCLGCMQNVVLLSELHPRAWRESNPLVQAHDWFGLLTPDDIARLSQPPRITYEQAIALIEQRCGERGAVLVLRDWAHLDYTGVPFNPSPAYRPELFAGLAGNFDIIRLSTTRDPVTQWLSLTRLPVMQEALKSGALGLDQFLLGYRKFAELCVETGFIRYEDFVREPEIKMREFCARLQITFDSNFIHNWRDYKTISGAVSGGRGGKEIQALPSHPIQPNLKEAFLANADYCQAIKLLGYDLVS